MEKRDVVASQTLRAALQRAEQNSPGLTFDLIIGIIKKGELNVNINESILRLQGAVSDTDCKFSLIFYVSSQLIDTLVQLLLSNLCNYITSQSDV